MPCPHLIVQDTPKLTDGRLVLAFSGWMDGGDVSTGTIDWLVNELDAQPAAEIEPEPFYLYSFPGSMEVSAFFRPYVRIEDGIIQEYEPPENAFYCVPEHDLVLFSGKEPNMNWSLFAGCILEFAQRIGITTIYFVGTVSGPVPHTRDPIIRSAVTNDGLKDALANFGVKFTDYEGPAAFATHLMQMAPEQGVAMASLVAEIPAYIDGANPKSIEAMIRKLSAILGIRAPLEELRTSSDAWEKRLNKELRKQDELSDYIHKLEEEYDSDVFNTQMGDLKDWLTKKGIRVD